MKADPTAECTQCGKPFMRRSTLQTICGVRCAMPYVRSIKAEAKADLKRREEAVKPRSKWLQEAQQAFNAWVRARDSGNGCISCGTHNGKANAGHYLSTGARPELRFEPLNVHLQCERCNTYLHGNLIPYRTALIQRIGLESVGWLEGPHPPKKYTVDELRTIRDEYRAKFKQLQD
jgi:endogenous inhibitor of DNA gyrase (YacG/DUF329 family)